MDAPSEHHLQYSFPTFTLKPSLPYTPSVSGGVSRRRNQHEALRTRPSPLSDSEDYEVEAHPRHANLRKKPKSISITSTSTIPEDHCTPSAHMRRVSGIQKTLSIPSFRPQPEPEDPRPQSSHSSTRPTTPLRSQSSNLGPNRSPSQKRKPPASHSSYGIETTLGPPPSYSTQRTLSQDRVWSVNQNSTTRERVTPQLHELPDVPKQTQPDRLLPEYTSALHNSDTADTDADASSPETLDTQSVATPQEASDMTPPTSADGSNIRDDADCSIRGLGLAGPPDDPKASSSEETNKSEDLFLNIAKTDASRLPEPVTRLDKRRSRISLPFLSGSRPSPTAYSSAMAPPIEDEHHDTQTDIPRRFGKRSSLGQHVPGALTSSQYFEDSRSTVSRFADHVSTAESNTGRPSTRSRRYSNANVDSYLRPPSRSQTGRTSRLVSENLYTSRFKPVDQPPTESTVSTTAPSTVWDELDELKSRIKKLELTGKLPPSSAAAMTSSERPRTATTQATTMSSSPKHKPAVSALPSAIEGIPSTTHPLLHEALSNAKSSVSNEVYQKLQATVSDALQLSALTSQESQTTLRGLMSPTDERQIRRRTESMCRSLTELAIALLSESKAVTSPAARPGSRDAGTVSALRSRRTSNEHTDRPPVTARVQSRLDSRRASLLNQQTASSPAQQTEFDTSAASMVSQPATTSHLMSRTSTVTRHRRTPGIVDGRSDGEESPSIRPVSRAMTDVPSGQRQSTRARATFSREYTKQHPLPMAQVDTSSNTTPLPANLVSRRTYPMPSYQTGTAVENCSPNTPSYQPASTSTHIPFQRPPFTISIERRKASHLSESPVSQSTPESNPGSGQRQASGRRSLGFASRISNVSSRLKAARAERMASSSASRSLPNHGAELLGEGQENMPASMQTRATAEEAGIVGEDS